MATVQLVLLYLVNHGTGIQEVPYFVDIVLWLPLAIVLDYKVGG